MAMVTGVRTETARGPMVSAICEVLSPAAVAKAKAS